jgi:phosphoserine aminotransferase
MTHRVYNFSAGPAVLPEPVLKQARDEMLALPNHGMSVLEISHRGQKFGEILEAAKTNLRALLDVPNGYHILFLQGGAVLQFSSVPMNLAGPAGAAQYIVTGSWGKKAADESKRLVPTKIAFDNGGDNYRRVPAHDELDIDPAGAYVYFTSNETIQGVQFASEPEVGDLPLVCDASSDFLCRPLPIEKYALIYACAQKNAGPAGVTIVILRDDLLARCQDNLPAYLDYRNHVKSDSMYNTPPTFGVYMVNLVAQWLTNEIGGLDKIYEQNQRKASMLYDAIDDSNGFYIGHAEPASRSIMNVTFRLQKDSLQDKFLEDAQRRELYSLKGHRSVGGIRASIYNAMPVPGVEQLKDFMHDFASTHS